MTAFVLRWIALPRHLRPHLAHAGEIHLHPIARRDRELPRERAAHDDLARLDAAAELLQLARQPDHRVQRIAEHRVAAPGRHGRAIDPHRRRDRVQRQVRRVPPARPAPRSSAARCPPSRRRSAPRSRRASR